MKRLGVDVGGTFTDLILYDEEGERIHVHKLASTPEDPAVAILQGVEEICAMASTEPSQLSAAAARHDGRHQHDPRTARREGGHDHHERLPGHPSHRPPPQAVHVQPDAGHPAAGAAADPAPVPPLRAGAHAGGRQRARPARRGRGGGGAGLPGRRGHRVRRRLLPQLVRQRGARGARQGDRRPGAAGRVRLGLQRGQPPAPRVRALLHGSDQRLHRPARGPLPGPPARPAARGRAAARPAPDAVLGRRDHLRQRAPVAGQPRAVGPGGRPPGWHRRGPPQRLREHDHARRRRHLGGHLRGARGRGSHEAPARLLDRRLPGDGPDDRHRDDRGRRRARSPRWRRARSSRSARRAPGPIRGRPPTGAAARTPR